MSKKKIYEDEPIDQKIISILKNHQEDGLTYKKIHKQCDTKLFTKTEIVKVVNDLELDGLIRKEKGNQFFYIDPNNRKGKKAKSPKKNYDNAIVGRVDLTSSGAAYVIVEGEDQDIYIPHTRVGKAFDGDKVAVRLVKAKHRSKPEGEIIDVVERRRTKFVGVLDINSQFAFFEPDNKKMRNTHFYVHLADTKNAESGDKVVVQYTSWQEGKKSPYGKVVEILGKPGENETEIISILAEKGFNVSFPKQVEKFVENISFEIPEKEITKRVDYRDITTFTIDPIDAKDFDDALSIQKLENGHYEIGVHIADVTHYCTPGTALDDEAFLRATSVYLVDRVSPMLPEKLSNGVCSLRPNEDKLCFSAIFEIDENGKIYKTNFSRTVIHSDRRFHYQEAQEIIDAGEGDLADELVLMNNISKKLRKKRIANGSIKFGRAEVRFRLDEDGKPLEVYEKPTFDTNLMIEDYMLLANRAVAEFFTNYSDKLKVPAVYRIHAAPNEDKIAQFATVAAKFGHKGDFSTPANIAKSLNKILDAVKGKPEQNMIETLGIRTMAKAVYSIENIGHYGLAFEDYTHFTSPIRRYPDVMVHRTLQELLDKKPKFDAKSLEEKCKYCSTQEKLAAEAERDSVKLKQCEYLGERLGEQFEGVISGVIERGVFVELTANKCEGFIRREWLGSDNFMYNEDMVELLGYNTKKRFRLGDPIEVIVANVSLENRNIDFDLVSKD